MIDASKLIDTKATVKPEAEGEACCAPLPAAAWPAGLGLRAQWHKALGDEVRLKLLHLMREQELCVCDLVDLMAMPQGTLSHHLAILVKAGLASVRKQGRWNHHQATPLGRQLLAFQPESQGAG